MTRLFLLVALMTMPAALAAQGLPVDFDSEPDAVSQPAPQADAASPRSAIRTRRPRPS
jgi:hypothetical protein